MRLLRPIVAPATRHALEDRFAPAEIRSVLADAFDDYDRHRPALPREPQIGPRWMVHLAALTAGFHRALLGRELDAAEARRRTAEVTWLVYQKLARIPWALARAMKRTPYERLKRATDLFRRFPFRAPSYDMVDVPAERGVVAFDVRRCPVADYLRTQGLSELCVDAWCSLDVPLAREWGARLERTSTLARGADRCDFRWVPDARVGASRRR